MNNELPQQEVTTKKLYNKTVASVALAIVCTAAVFVAGIRYEKSNEPVRLPANAACIAYADSVAKGLQASQNQLVAVISGKDMPQVDFETIKKQLAECKATQGEVTVKVEATK